MIKRNFKKKSLLFSVFQKLPLKIKERLGQIHIDGLRIDQTTVLIPQGIKLLLADCLDAHGIRGLVDALSV